MSTDAANIFYGPLHNLRLLVAASASFQAMVGFDCDYVVTGDIAPDATGNYTANGTQNDQPAYELAGGAFWLWYNSGLTRWVISAVKGVTGAAWFRSPAAAIAGSYVAVDAATGTAVVSTAAAAALDHVHAIALAAEDGDAVAAMRPFALVDVGQAWNTIQTGERSYRRDGSLWLDIESAISGDDDRAAAGKTFYKLVGDIVDEMLDLAGIDGYLAVHNVALENGPSRSSDLAKADEGDYYQIILRIDWGP